MDADGENNKNSCSYRITSVYGGSWTWFLLFVSGVWTFMGMQGSEERAEKGPHSAAEAAWPHSAGVVHEDGHASVTSTTWEHRITLDRRTLTTNFWGGFSGRIFGTDFRDGFSGRIFGTDFRDGFSGRIFGTDFRDGFWTLLGGVASEGGFPERIFWGAPNPSAQSVKNRLTKFSLGMSLREVHWGTLVLITLWHMHSAGPPLEPFD